MTWGTGGRAQHSIEAVLGTCFGEPVLPCLMDFQGHGILAGGMVSWLVAWYPGWWHGILAGGMVSWLVLNPHPKCSFAKNTKHQPVALHQYL